MAMNVSERFIDQLTSSQSRILGSIMISVANANDAKDVLQRTNLTLWKNAERFDESRPFLPWAIATARLEVRAYYRDKKRDRLVFDEDLIEELQNVADQRVQELSLRQEALRCCLQKMKEEHNSLLVLRYAQGKSMGQISSLCGRSEDGVRSLMLRIRKLLRGCIEQQVTRQS